MVGVWENRYDFEKEENHISITVSRRLKYIDVTIVAEIKANLVEILFSVLRFENLFLGHFYKTESLVLDEDEIISNDKKFLIENRWMSEEDIQPEDDFTKELDEAVQSVRKNERSRKLNSEQSGRGTFSEMSGIRDG